MDTMDANVAYTHTFCKWQQLKTNNYLFDLNISIFTFTRFLVTPPAIFSFVRYAPMKTNWTEKNRMWIIMEKKNIFFHRSPWTSTVFLFISCCDNINKLRMIWKRFVKIVKKCYIRSGQGVVPCLFFCVAAYICELLSVGQMQQKKRILRHKNSRYSSKIPKKKRRKRVGTSQTSWLARFFLFRNNFIHNLRASPMENVIEMAKEQIFGSVFPIPSLCQHFVSSFWV